MCINIMIILTPVLHTSYTGTGTKLLMCAKSQVLQALQILDELWQQAHFKISKLCDGQQYIAIVSSQYKCPIFLESGVTSKHDSAGAFAALDAKTF